WTPVSTLDAPSARELHTAIWTGTEMLIWGGGMCCPASAFNDGGRYDPATDSWTPVSTLDAPSAREDHTAVWTGGEMIVWGGFRLPYDFNTGGRYDPISDSWTPVSMVDAPSAREGQTAIWTGTEMLIWGGVGHEAVNTGGRYDPGSDSWAPTSALNAPGARWAHTAVWTETEMIVWGGVA